MVDLAKLAPDGPEMRAIRGAEIALIFQEPMSSFSPVHTVGNQIVEAIMLHQRLTAGRRATRRSRCCGESGCRRRSSAWTSSPTS